jgi:hypothetical protein
MRNVSGRKRMAKKSKALESVCLSIVFLHIPLSTFRAVAARTMAASNPSPALLGRPTIDTLAKTTPAPSKKEAKRSLKGVVVKKKLKPAASSSSDAKAKENGESDSVPPDAKRRKVSTS